MSGLLSLPFSPASSGVGRYHRVPPLSLLGFQNLRNSGHIASWSSCSASMVSLRPHSSPYTKILPSPFRRKDSQGSQNQSKRYWVGGQLGLRTSEPSLGVRLGLLGTSGPSLGGSWDSGPQSHLRGVGRLGLGTSELSLGGGWDWGLQNRLPAPAHFWGCFWRVSLVAGGLCGLWRDLGLSAVQRALPSRSV